MPDLFQLPKVIPLNLGVTMPGATLDFFISGTSTRQNTYTDAALTVPHSNPVVADANGVFAPIFLDPNLPSYRVTLKTAGGSTMPGYPVDDIPSLSTAGSELIPLRYASDSGTANALAVTLSNPSVTSYSSGLTILVKTSTFNTLSAVTINVNGLGARTITHPDGSALVAGEISGQIILITYNALAARFDMISPAYAPGLTYGAAVKVASTNTGASVTGDIDISGEYKIGGVSIAKTGSFTGTLTGMTTTVTGTFNYRMLNFGVFKVVNLYSNSNLSGTSNSSLMNLTGMPSEILPPLGKLINCGECGAFDNGIGTVAFSVISNNLGVGEISFAPVSGSTWTASGIKGLSLISLIWFL